jgi:hypothetical protein
VTQIVKTISSRLGLSKLLDNVIGILDLIKACVQVVRVAADGCGHDQRNFSGYVE